MEKSEEYIWEGRDYWIHFNMQHYIDYCLPNMSIIYSFMIHFYVLQTNSTTTSFPPPPSLNVAFKFFLFVKELFYWLS